MGSKFTHCIIIVIREWFTDHVAGSDGPMEQEIEKMLAESGRPSRFYVHRKSIIAASLVVLITNSIVEYAGIFRGKISASIMFFINIASAMVILAIVALTTVNNESEESMTSES